MLKFNIVTIFPSIFDSYMTTSILGRAQKNKIIKIKTYNPRNFTKDKHLSVDDKPYGGGAGMVLMAEPVIKAIDQAKKNTSGKKIKTIIFSAKGNPYTQNAARKLAKYDEIIFVCGRYEGIDERVKKITRAEEISIGPYVLTDGEIAAMVVMSSVSRLLPGAITFESLQEESHWEQVLSGEESTGSSKSLEYPHYTRPETITYKGRKYCVPKVLLSGDHAAIKNWREEHSR